MMYLLIALSLLLVGSFLIGKRYRAPEELADLYSLFAMALLVPFGSVVEAVMFGYEVIATGLVLVIFSPIVWLVALIPTSLAYSAGRRFNRENRRGPDFLTID